MKRIKTFAALGLLIYGLASYATPALAAAACPYGHTTRSVGLHQDHWTTIAADGCTVSWTANRIADYCDTCGVAYNDHVEVSGVHSPCGKPEKGN